MFWNMCAMVMILEKEERSMVIASTLAMQGEAVNIPKVMWTVVIHSCLLAASHSLHKKLKFSIKDFFSKCLQIRSFLNGKLNFFAQCSPPLNRGQEKSHLKVFWRIRFSRIFLFWFQENASREKPMFLWEFLKNLLRIPILKSTCELLPLF